MIRPLRLPRTASIGLVVIAALPLALLLGGAWFLHHYEKKPYQVHRGIAPAALANPLLAAEQYLRALNKESYSRNDLEFLNDLPSPADALVIGHLPGAVGKATHDRLLAWVEAGGHLLVTPGGRRADALDRDDLFSRLGVQPVQHGDQGAGGCAEEEQEVEDLASRQNPPAGGTDDDGEPEPVESIISLELDRLPVRLRHNGANLLEDHDHKADFRINGSQHLVYEGDSIQNRERKTLVEEDADWLLEYRIGAGKITILSDMSVFFNDSIGDYDHAFLLSWLVQHRSRIWLLPDAEARPLPLVLWQLSPTLWLSLLVLLLLLGWRMQRPSGPLLAAIAPAEGNLLAHLDGTGRYHWRIDSAAAMIVGNRRALSMRWANRKLGGVPSRKSVVIEPAILVERTGIPPAEIEAAMSARVEGEQALIQTSKAMQRLEHHLQRRIEPYDE